jgi:hypothetical protein
MDEGPLNKQSLKTLVNHIELTFEHLRSDIARFSKSIWPIQLKKPPGFVSSAAKIVHVPHCYDPTIA